MTRRRQGISPAGRGAHAGRYRIIAGRWRGRRLAFPDEGGVRPTGDRVRETLFNWLRAVVPGTSCLDLFAGSGALGIEALSRGAAQVVFVDRNRALVRAVEANLALLGATGGQCLCMDADRYLSGPAAPFDLVFLDPPFGSTDWADLCARLERGGWLAPGARVYIEHAASQGPPQLPAGWELLRSASAGNVGYHLASAPDRNGALPTGKE